MQLHRLTGRLFTVVPPEFVRLS